MPVYGVPKDHGKSELSAEEVGQRVRLARLYRGFKLRSELEEELKRRQLPHSLLGRIERGKDALLEPMRRDLMEVLQFPEVWFTEPFKGLFEPEVAERPEPSLAARLDALEQKIENVVGEAMTRLLERLPPANPTSGQDRDAKER